MRVVLISDLHGNLPALAAFEGYLAAHPAEQVICLGDVAMVGPQPRQAIDWLRRRKFPVVMGNTDEWCLNPQPFPSMDEKLKKMYEIELWGRQQLDVEDLETIRSYQAVIELPLPGNRTLLCCHGAPGAIATNISGLTSQVELVKLVGGTSAQVIACGHTHAQLLRRVGEKIVINAGSLGRPVEVDAAGQIVSCPWAEFACIDAGEDYLRFSFERIEYDVAAFFAIVRASGMPHAEWFLAGYRS